MMPLCSTLEVRQPIIFQRYKEVLHTLSVFCFVASPEQQLQVTPAPGTAHQVQNVIYTVRLTSSQSLGVHSSLHLPRF